MKYTRKYNLKDGRTKWVFTPPLECRLEGIAKPEVFFDGRTARWEIPRLIAKVEEYYSYKAEKDAPISRLIKNYTKSEDFRALKRSSQQNYLHLLKTIEEDLGDVKLSKLTTGVCRKAYNKWLEEGGAYRAYRLSSIFSVLINYFCSMELIDYNPMAKVKKRKPTPKSYVWDKKQVKDFLDVCFSKFEYRNVGLITLMCYEWAQRPVDVIGLKWEDIDFEQGKVTITQTKRGATVYLPLTGILKEMLEEQKEDWGFQGYVAPDPRPRGMVYKAYSRAVFTSRVNKVKEEAGIPDHLQIGYMRKTAINEMVEAQVDSAAIMQVTGHRSLASLNPYIKHTFSGASAALEARTRHHKKEYSNG